MANSSFIPNFYLLPDHCFSGFKVCYPPFEYSTEAITTCFQTVNIYFKVQYVFTGSSRPFAWSFQHKKSPWAKPRAIRVCVWKDHVSQQGTLIHDLFTPGRGKTTSHVPARTQARRRRRPSTCQTPISNGRGGICTAMAFAVSPMRLSRQIVWHGLINPTRGTI